MRIVKLIRDLHVWLVSIRGGHASAARSALSRAIGLTADARVGAYLATQDAPNASAS